MSDELENRLRDRTLADDRLPDKYAADLNCCPAHCSRCFMTPRIHLIRQDHDEWGEPVDHSPAPLQLNEAGRQALIEALMTGASSIECFGQSGGQYTLHIEILEGTHEQP